MTKKLLKNRQQLHKEDFNGLIQCIEENGFVFEYLNEKLDLFQVLI